MNTQQTCPDCGAGVGQPHKTNCDIERCSICGKQRLSCCFEDHDPAKSTWTGEWTIQKAKPAFIGVAVLARPDHTQPLSLTNSHWRTAVSEEEARCGHELYVGEELKNRFLELERQGWIEISDEGRKILDGVVQEGEQQPTSRGFRFIQNTQLRKLNRIAARHGKHCLTTDCPVMKNGHNAPILRALPGIESAGWVRCEIPATADCTVHVFLDIRVEDFEELPIQRM